MARMLDTFSMQVNVPHSKYGDGTYFIAPVLQEWLAERGLQGRYCSGSSCGDGYTNGVTNKESHYMVNGIKDRETCLMFAIIFSDVKIHVCQEYSYD